MLSVDPEHFLILTLYIEPIPTKKKVDIFTFSCCHITQFNLCLLAIKSQVGLSSQGESAGHREVQRDGEHAACQRRQSADRGKERGVEIELRKGRVFTSS